jgi:chromosome segregation ATPase
VQQQLMEEAAKGAALEDKVAVAQSAIREFEQLVIAREQSLSVSEEERCLLQQQVQTTSAELSAAKSLLHSLEQEKAALETAFDKCKARAEEASSAMEKYDLAAVELESLRSSQHSMQQHQVLLTQQLADLRQVRESLLSELQQRSADSSGVSEFLHTMSDENLQLKTKLAANNQRLVALEDENEKLLVQLAAAVQDSKTKVSEWTTQLRVLCDERDRLRDQLDTTVSAFTAETGRNAALATAAEDFGQRLSATELQSLSFEQERSLWT